MDGGIWSGEEPGTNCCSDEVGLYKEKDRSNRALPPFVPWSRSGDVESYAESDKEEKDEAYVREQKMKNFRTMEILCITAFEMGDVTEDGPIEKKPSARFGLHAIRDAMKRVREC